MNSLPLSLPFPLASFVKRVFAILLPLCCLTHSESLFANVVEVAGYRFVAPNQWRAGEPSSSMRAAQFEVSSEDGKKAELVFFYFGRSGGGGIRANLDRWMNQFEDLSESKTEEEVVNEVKVTFARVAGTFLSGSPLGPKTPKPGYRLLGAIVQGREGFIFIKLTGPANTVLANENALLEMIKGALSS